MCEGGGGVIVGFYGILCLFIYSCVILHSNDLLRHHVVDCLTGKGCHQSRQNSETQQCSVARAQGR